MQEAPGVPRPSRLNKWWPISFFIAAIVFFVIGGALMGTWVANSYDDCSYSSSSYYSYYSSYSCVDTDLGEFYAAIAMFVIGGVLKLTAWILLIVFCVKRSRANHHTVTYYTTPAVQQPQSFQQPYAAPQPTYAPPHQAAQFPRSPASPGPSFPEMANPSLAGTPPPKEPVQTATAFKYCGQCGTAVSSRFCPQCGTQG
ncbi:hypothetical protein N7532_009947 [Penicillium argentinense]|uniref:Uncharacterized protein n=1 Tax=Penicillium argentinense TaxID=1131581 RepID=A0A9W9ENR2_9EURO|nr:uncharacterized protein N7532_009947 [Penicillium argentinense]KAJ5085176.1 hypothetical protein N7532_009947 [Penicillium argentinense]